jgi:hypothetical protein
MKTPEQQAKEIEEKNKEFEEKTIIITPSENQLDTILLNRIEKGHLEEKLAILNRHENQLVDFLLEGHNIDLKNVQTKQLTPEGKIAVLLKVKVEKKEEKKENGEAKSEDLTKELMEVAKNQGN